MASGKTLQSTIEISGVLSPSLQSAINNAVDKLADLAEETLESADAATRLSVEMSAQEDILKNLQKAYAGYVANGEESSEQAQDLARRIQAVSGELEENRDTLQAAEKAAKSLTDEQEDAADAFAKLERKINSQEDELAALRRQYSNVVLEQGESSDEARQLANRISDLSGELNQNRQQLRDAEQAADSYADALEDAGASAENSSEGYTVLKNVIANLVTEGIEMAVEAFKRMATEGDSALATLTAKTGATASEMAGFEDVMYEVYNANYGESLGDVSDTLSTVIQMTDDLDNASLANITKHAITLEDVFGFDTVESMRAVNSLMDQFGITSEEAFNLIVQGAQNGLDQNGDLLDTINEYSVQFANVGYSADDMFNMLANGVESGTWSVDKLGDAVKEFNIRMSDGSAQEAVEALGFSWEEVSAAWSKGGDEANEVFNMLISELDGLENTTEGYNIGVGLMGTMYEDLGQDAVLALSQTEGAISGANDAMQQMDSAAYDTLEHSLSQLGRTIEAEVWQPIAQKLTPVIKQAVNFVTTQVAPAVDWLLNHLPEVGVALGSIGTIVAAIKWGDILAKLAQIKSAISAVIAAIGGVAAPVWVVVAVVATLALAFTNLWKNNEEFREKIVGIWEGTKGKFEEFGQAITDRLNALGFDFENFGEVMSTAWDSFCALLAPIFEGLFQQLSNILSSALDLLLGIFDIFAGIFSGDWDMVWQGVQEVFGSVWQLIVSTLSNYLNVFKNLADTVLGWFGTSWEEVWSNTQSFFVNTWNSIVSFFSGIWSSITSFCSSAWNTIKNVVQVGILTVKGLLDAAFQIITLPFRFIWENCKDAVMAAWTFIHDTIGSKIDAAKEKITLVTEAIKLVASAAWQAISTTASTIWNTIQSTIGSKIDAVQQKISFVTETIKLVASAAWQAISTTASTIWNTIQSTIGSKITAAQTAVSTAVNTIKSNVSSTLNSALSTVQSIFGSIYDSISGKLESAKSAVSDAIEAIKSAFDFEWSLPSLKLPHISISGDFSIDPPSAPSFSIDWYANGGILTRPTIFGASGSTLLGGGEAGAEAVLPLAVLWDKLEAMMHSVFNASSDEGLTSKAGELLTLDDFSLGSLADGTNVVYYYDFSGFTWSPQIQTNGNSEDDDLMARLKEHEAEFFDWLEEFIKMREVSQYA